MAALLIIQAEAARCLKRERIFRDRSQDLDLLNDQELISRYRFPRRTILELTEQIRRDIERPTTRSHAIPAHIQVMTTLRFLAKGNYQSETGDIHGISRSSVSRAVNSVCTAINAPRVNVYARALFPEGKCPLPNAGGKFRVVCSSIGERTFPFWEYSSGVHVHTGCNGQLQNIKFPVNIARLREMKEEFHGMSSFPNCVGAIDGTLIPIQGMADDAPYVCRKGFHALNIQAVVDANMRFINLNAKYPGSTHDAFILNASMVPELVQALPEEGWLVGDSGYPLKTWLLTPLHNPSTPSQIRYNTAHMRTRTVVERAFGILKSRFRCLSKTGGALPFNPCKCSKVIESCFRLHNLAINANIPLPNGDEVQLINNNIIYCNAPAREAQNVRERVISQF